MAGLVALSGAVFAACAHEDPKVLDMRVEDMETGWSASRQAAVRVNLDGSVMWEGRTVSDAELGMLMRQAALGAPELLLVVVPVADEVRYGDVMKVMQMASTYGIEAKIVPTGGSAE